MQQEKHALKVPFISKLYLSESDVKPKLYKHQYAQAYIQNKG